ncbi:MAG TPA: PucC family protein [Actinocrinis sp.]|nr:PucC family protein [Actinocrinis sp.]
MPLSVAMGVASWIAGAYLMPRYGARLMFVGLPVVILGVLGAVAALHASRAGAYPTALLPALGVIGLGAGLFASAFFTTTLRPLRPQEIGSAAGLINAVQQLGATLGVTVLGGVYLSAARPDAGNAALHAVQLAFVLAAAIPVVTVVTSALMVGPLTGPAGRD